MLELDESARQGQDAQFADILSRARLANAAEVDIACLNERCLKDEELRAEANAWRVAPILAALSMTVNASSVKAALESGKIMGACNIRPAPALRKCQDELARKRVAERHFQSDEAITLSGSEFRPLKQLVVYDGMPVMLRANVCPELGL